MLCTTSLLSAAAAAAAARPFGLLLSRKGAEDLTVQQCSVRYNMQGYRLLR